MYHYTPEPAHGFIDFIICLCFAVIGLMVQNITFVGQVFQIVAYSVTIAVGCVSLYQSGRKWYEKKHHKRKHKPH